MKSAPCAVDSSAVVAVLLAEPGHEGFIEALANASEIWMGSFSVLETSIVIASKKGPAGLMALDALLQRLDVQFVPLTPGHIQLARDAWLRFGKGRHPAALNIGDCCAYATALHAGLPLMFAGDDFAKTDIARFPA